MFPTSHHFFLFSLFVEKGARNNMNGPINKRIMRYGGNTQADVYYETEPAGIESHKSNSADVE